MNNAIVSIFGVTINNLSSHEARESIAEFIRGRNGGSARAVFFVNVHSVHLARRVRGFMETLRGADLVLADGSGLSIAGRIFGQPIRENLNGTDFTPKLLADAEREGWTVYLFGGRDRVVTRTRQVLQKMYPGLSIVGASPGFLGSEFEAAFVEDIQKKRPDIVLVGLGSPKQEEWIARHAPKLQAGVCMGVGGLFDFISGRFRRAPLWMRSLGIEWIYRFLQDPATKWSRVFVEIPQFLASVLIAAMLQRRVLRNQGS